MFWVETYEERYFFQKEVKILNLTSLSLAQKEALNQSVIHERTANDCAVLLNKFANTHVSIRSDPGPRLNVKGTNTTENMLCCGPISILNMLGILLECIT
ncbi:hypothetical protein XENOCAPTIV_001356 [Xenoophorus captivus]|uniref:Uncharacterized protein n=1 Tax=Xenoophorus captivus TaxID=1517983 RepID=A0ABV0RPY7_9TELE